MAMISGTPTAAITSLETFNFNVAVTDSAPATPVTVQQPATVAIEPLPALQYFNVPADHQAVPADQLSILLGVQQPSSLNITGNVSLSFIPDQGVPFPSNSNQQVGFLEGRNISAAHSYSVPPNCALPSCGQPLTLQAGNVAGSITMHVTSLTTSDPNLPPSLLIPNDQTITMPKLIPSVDPAQISIRNIAGGFEVCIPGFSTPRDMATAAFRFVPADKASLRVPPEPQNVTTKFAVLVSGCELVARRQQFYIRSADHGPGRCRRSRLPIRYSNELGGLHRRVRTYRYSNRSALQRGVLVRCQMSSPAPMPNQPVIRRRIKPQCPIALHHRQPAYPSAILQSSWPSPLR